jgi:hypothetical protein
VTRGRCGVFAGVRGKLRHFHFLRGKFELMKCWKLTIPDDISPSNNHCLSFMRGVSCRYALWMCSEKRCVLKSARASKLEEEFVMLP